MSNDTTLLFQYSNKRKCFMNLSRRSDDGDDADID
jgi:hypothetical protein